MSRVWLESQIISFKAKVKSSHKLDNLKSETSHESYDLNPESSHESWALRSDLSHESHKSQNKSFEVRAESQIIRNQGSWVTNHKLYSQSKSLIISCEVRVESWIISFKVRLESWIISHKSHNKSFEVRVKSQIIQSQVSRVINHKLWCQSRVIN